MTCAKCEQDPCVCEIQPVEWRKTQPPELPDGVHEPFPLTLVRRYRQRHQGTYKEAVLAVLPAWIHDNPNDEHTECAVELVSRAVGQFRPRTVNDPPSVYGMEHADRTYQLCEAYHQGGMHAVRQFIKDHPITVVLFILAL